MKALKGIVTATQQIVAGLVTSMEMSLTFCLQISTAIRALAKEAACKDNPFIICGDFNSPPDSPGYQLARDGRLSGSALDTVRSIDIPQVRALKIVLIA